MEMANASGVSLVFEFADIPFLSGARRYAEQWIFPGGAADNRNHFESHVRFADSIHATDKMLLFDPQTSGGLLLGVPAGHLASFLARAKELGQPAWPVGSVKSGKGIEVR